jgi:hypothetical protein
VDGNGDGRRGADIGAYEAKAKAHRGGKGNHGGKGGKGGKGKGHNQAAHHGGTGHHSAHWAQHGVKNHRLAYRT